MKILFFILLITFNFQTRCMEEKKQSEQIVYEVNLNKITEDINVDFTYYYYEFSSCCSCFPYLSENSFEIVIKIPKKVTFQNLKDILIESIKSHFPEDSKKNVISLYNLKFSIYKKSPKFLSNPILCNYEDTAQLDLEEHTNITVLDFEGFYKK